MPTKVVPFFEKASKIAKKSSTLNPKIQIFGLIVLSVVIVGGLLILILFAAAPCTFKRCHPNARCINLPFKAKCKCINGFQGNGIDCDECGLTFPNSTLNYSKYDPSTYIHYRKGGNPVVPFSYPSAVDMWFYWESILYTDKANYYYWKGFECAGVIINRRSILTAASCFPRYFNISPSGYNNDTLTIPFSFDPAYPTWNQFYEIFAKPYLYYSLGRNEYPSERLFIDEVYVHHLYIDGSLDYDLAVIKLLSPMKLDQYGQIACIPDETDIPIKSKYLAVNTSAITVGWNYYYGPGYAYVGYLFSEHYHNILDIKSCAGLYPQTPDLNQLICAGEWVYYPWVFNNDYYSRFCNGPTGGPLYVNKMINGVNKLMVLGIALNDTQCGISVYANLFDFLTWIEEHSDY